MTRVALRVAYDGTRFSGLQWQPGRRTVHGELAAGLQRLGMPQERIRWSGRTDAGVSAAGNIVAIDVENLDASLLPALTFQMEDVWVWASAVVDEDFEPRHAASRSYRYHLTTDLDAAPLREALSVFLGEQDYSGFAILKPNVEPRRLVHSIHVKRRGGMLIIDVQGRNFVWNQVRRMVEAGKQIAEGRLTRKTVEASLQGERSDFGVAAPEPLVLMDIDHPRARFEPVDPNVRRRIFERLTQRRNALMTEATVAACLLGEDDS